MNGKRPDAQAGVGTGSVLRLALAAFVLSSLLAANALALQYLYNDSRLHKPDYRAAALRIQQGEMPGDVILVDGPDPQKVFLHYYHGAAPVHDLRSLSSGTDEAQVDATLAAAVTGAPRAWGLLYFHSLARSRPGWPSTAGRMGRRCTTAFPSLCTACRQPPLDGSDGNRRVRPGTRAGASGDVVSGPGDNGVPRCLRAGKRLACRAGELLQITTRWNVAQPSPARKFSLRLQDAAGRIWAAEDYVPRDGFAPVEIWAPGQPAADQRGLFLPADLPPGDYQVTLRLYDPRRARPFLLPVERAPAGRCGAGRGRRPAGSNAPDPASLGIPA